ncbi:MAG TPA: hypothetical protein VFS21_13140 [Roseiflexaceae bacterium]|nr:hypothetical protein [Roseiflexaceae bacterium]
MSKLKCTVVFVLASMLIITPASTIAGSNSTIFRPPHIQSPAKTTKLSVDCRRTLSSAEGRFRARMLNICQQPTQQTPYVGSTESGDCGFLHLQATPLSGTEEVYFLVQVGSRQGDISMLIYAVTWYNTSHNESGFKPYVASPGVREDVYRDEVNPGGIGDVTMKVEHLYMRTDKGIICSGIPISVSFYNTW